MRHPVEHDDELLLVEQEVAKAIRESKDHSVLTAMHEQVERQPADSFWHATVRNLRNPSRKIPELEGSQ